MFDVHVITLLFEEKEHHREIQHSLFKTLLFMASASKLLR